MQVLIQFPALAIIPAAAFIFLWSKIQNRWILATGCSWAFYVAYEFLMKFRILCSGECNIRIDLLLIYPLLLILTVVSVVAAVKANKKSSSE